MKDRFVVWLPVFMVVAVATTLVAAQSNMPPALVLPPGDWDAGKHALAPFVATNTPGDYPLPGVWAGVEKVTARSGKFAAKDPAEKDELVEFDRFVVTHGPVFPLARDDRFISNGRNGAGAIYRRSLPSDAELLAMRDVSSVSNYFGWNPFSSKITNGLLQPLAEGPSLVFFTLRPYDSIETVRSTFFKRPRSSTIDSILIKRARLHPQSKTE